MSEEKTTTLRRLFETLATHTCRYSDLCGVVTFLACEKFLPPATTLWAVACGEDDDYIETGTLQPSSHSPMNESAEHASFKHSPSELGRGVFFFQSPSVVEVCPASTTTPTLTTCAGSTRASGRDSGKKAEVEQEEDTRSLRTEVSHSGGCVAHVGDVTQRGRLSEAWHAHGLVHTVRPSDCGKKSSRASDHLFMD